LFYFAFLLFPFLFYFVFLPFISIHPKIVRWLVLHVFGFIYRWFLTYDRAVSCKTHCTLKIL
jgi:hypothetical protein